MSTAEKGFFKKYSAVHGRKSSNYIQLFDAIDRQKTFDEGKLIQKFEGSSIAKHFSVSKNYLYNALLASLEEFHKGSTPYDQIVHNLLRIELLINRDLINAGELLLNQTKKLILKHRLFEFSITMTRLELYLMRQKEDLKGIQKRIDGIMERWQNDQEKANIQLQFRYRSSQLLWLLRMGRSSEHDPIATLIKEDPIYQIPDEELGYDETMRKYNTLAMIASMENDELTSFQYAEKLLDFSESYPEYIRTRPYNHMIRYQNLLSKCLRLRKFKLIPEIVRNMKAFPERYKVKTKDTIDKMIFVRSNGMEFGYLFECGLDDPLVHNVQSLEEGLSNPIYRVEPIWRLALSFSLGCYYLGYAKNPEVCLDWVDAALHDQESRLDRRYLFCARILFLFAHLALDNLLFIQSRLPETIQFMNKHQIQAAPAQHLVQLFKDLCKPLHQTERHALLIEALTYYLAHRGQFDLFSGYRTLMQTILMYFHEAAIRPHLSTTDHSVS